MMTLNDVLMKLFKLPPGVRMAMAVVGFGSLATLAYFIWNKFLKRMYQQEQWGALAALAGVLVVGALVVWFVIRMRRGASVKKGQQLSGELAGQQPVGDGDAREAQRSNREKFLQKVGRMRELGLNTYSMPWYTLLGEPACGKTASLLNSGVDFPLGQEEVAGYGGTRNYNWWFTNEAVILDTAGRLSFQEEGTTDRPEWEGFLQLLKKHRPRCPLNGVIVAIPATALLSDTSEERDRKATVLRERLRQLHHGLGVRYPVVIIVTKSDLIAGFSEFFDEFRNDVPLRRQMIGWSRPGSFQEPWDPNGFATEFDRIYDRLRDWAMRYLQRNALERELGMVVTFPEALRALRKPLQEYVAKIFQPSQLVEPPFFRGLYFTSACQEGAPIMSIFDKSHVGGLRVGGAPGAASRAVDSKPFFIQGVYEDKVFQEKGLVFRSSKHFKTTRRTHILVWSGCAAMVAAMATFFGYGCSKTEALISAPQTACETAIKRIKGEETKSVTENLALANELRQASERYEAPGAQFHATMLYLLADISDPQEKVQAIHANFTLHCLVRPLLIETDRKLREIASLDAPPAGITKQSYIDALAAFTRTYGYLVGLKERTDKPLEDAKGRAEDVAALYAFVAATPMPASAASGPASQPAEAEIVTHARLALERLAKDKVSYGPTLLGERLKLADESWKQNMRRTIEFGMDRVRDYWKPRTDLTEIKRLGEDLQYWITFIVLARDLDKRYVELLGTRTDFEAAAGASGPESLKLFTGAAEAYKARSGDLTKANVEKAGDAAKEFVGAYNALADFVKQKKVPQILDGNKVRIQRLMDTKNALAAEIERDYRRVEAALAEAAPRDPVSAGAKPVYDVIDQQFAALKKEIEDKLTSVLADLKSRIGDDPLEYYYKQELVTYTDSKEGAPAGPPMVAMHPNSLGRDQILTKVYLTDLEGASGSLKDIAAGLDKFREWPGILEKVKQSGGASTGVVFGKARTFLEAAEKNNWDDATRTKEAPKALDLTELWRPYELCLLTNSVNRARQESGKRSVLGEMERIARDTVTQPKLPGLARLMGDQYNQADSSLPFTRSGRTATPPPQPVAPATPLPATPPPATAPFNPFAPAGGTPPPASSTAASQPAPTPAPAVDVSDWILVKYHSRAFLADTFLAYQDVDRKLAEMGGADALRTELKKSAEKYVGTYFSDWNEVATKPAMFFDSELLGLLRQCRDNRFQWDSFKDEIGKRGGPVASNLAARLTALVRDGICVMAEPALKEKLTGDYKGVIGGVATTLNQQGKCLTLKYASLYQSAESNPSGLGSAVVQAFGQYAGLVKAGASVNEDALKKLSDGLNYPPAETSEPFSFTEPLALIARYGAALYASEMEGILAKKVSAYAGKFPVVDTVSGGEAVLSGDELIAFLKDVMKVRTDYGAALAALQGSEGAATRFFQRCDAWAKFLFGAQGVEALTQGGATAAVATKVAIAEPNDVLNARAVYNKLSVTLPLKGQAGGTVDFNMEPEDGKPVRIESAADQAKLRWLPFTWSPSATGDLSARLSAKHRADVVGPDPAESSLKQSGSALVLLRVMRTNEGSKVDQNTYRLPFRWTLQNTYGVDVTVQFEREYPGEIAPFRKSAAAPTMPEADKYLR